MPEHMNQSQPNDAGTQNPGSYCVSCRKCKYSHMRAPENGKLRKVILNYCSFYHRLDFPETQSSPHN